MSERELTITELNTVKRKRKSLNDVRAFGKYLLAEFDLILVVENLTRTVLFG